MVFDAAEIFSEDAEKSLFLVISVVASRLWRIASPGCSQRWSAWWRQTFFFFFNAGSLLSLDERDKSSTGCVISQIFCCLWLTSHHRTSNDIIIIIGHAVVEP